MSCATAAAVVVVVRCCLVGRLFLNGASSGGPITGQQQQQLVRDADSNKTTSLYVCHSFAAQLSALSSLTFGCSALTQLVSIRPR